MVFIMPSIRGYSDANQISDADKIKDTSGYVLMLEGGTIFMKIL